MCEVSQFDDILGFGYEKLDVGWLIGKAWSLVFNFEGLDKFQWLVIVVSHGWLADWLNFKCGLENKFDHDSVHDVRYVFAFACILVKTWFDDKAWKAWNAWKTTRYHILQKVP